MSERPIDLSSAVVDDLQGEFNEEVLSSVPAEFLTGPAGTGKTFQIMGRIQENPKYGVLAATTGVAAVNLGSITINSLLKYFDTDSLHDRYMSGKLNQTLAEIGMDKHNLVIDECSMMCADQLDIIFKATSEVNCRSKFKRNPLGIVLVGDMAQLAPVKAKWVFEAKCWPAFARNITSLTKIHRQSDPIFIEALSQARRGDGLAAVDLLLKSGVKFTDALDTHFEGTTIVPKNADVGRFNYIALQRVQGRMLRVRCVRRGKQRREWLWNASTFTGIPDEMGVKINSLVMILANDTPRFTYVNGDLGYVRDYENGKFLVELLRNGAKVYVGPVTREIVQKEEPSESYEDGFPILTEQGWVLGTITYYPLRAGYASTTHKSQGLTLDRVQIDCRGHFFGHPNSAYVALSRARTSDGLRIVGPPEILARRIQIAQEVLPWV